MPEQAEASWVAAATKSSTHAEILHQIEIRSTMFRVTCILRRS